jgi:hypothetical protein
MFVVGGVSKLNFLESGCCVNKMTFCNKVSCPSAINGAGVAISKNILCCLRICGILFAWLRQQICSLKVNICEYNQLLFNAFVTINSCDLAGEVLSGCDFGFSQPDSVSPALRKPWAVGVVHKATHRG